MGNGGTISPLSEFAAGPDIERAGLRRAADRFSRGFATHRNLYIIALFTFSLALVVAPISGNWPDFDIVGQFGFYIAVAAGVGIFAGLIVKFFHLALVEKPKSPSLAMLRWLKETLFHGDRAVNTAHSFIVLLFFVSGFSILKGAIGLLHPFDWDVFFRDLDIAVSFGRLPHDWLGWLITQPLAVWLINFNYNLWFFIILGSYFLVGMSARNSENRMRYLTSFMLLWLIAGVFIAFTFSSAGPVYFERLGFGSDYAPLMADLHTANDHFRIWALSTQEMLWDGFTGARKGSAGISAFPSLHVASSVLLAIYATHCRSRFAPLAWLFAAAILLGSVVLGWHYAVDGYAGALLAWLVWRLSGWNLLRTELR